MATFKVTAPRPVTRKVAGVLFVDGVAEVREAADRAALAYFRRHRAYRIEALDTDTDAVEAAGVEEPVQEPDLPMPARNASTDEWRAYAVLAGMPDDEAATKSRDELVAHFTKGEGA